MLRLVFSLGFGGTFLSERQNSVYEGTGNQERGGADAHLGMTPSKASPWRSLRGSRRRLKGLDRGLIVRRGSGRLKELIGAGAGGPRRFDRGSRSFRRDSVGLGWVQGST